MTDTSVDLRGFEVFAPNGERLGTVVKTEDDTFTVRKGHVLPTEIDVPYDDIAETIGLVVQLNRDPRVFSDWQADPHRELVDRPVTGAEAGYDFGGRRPDIKPE